MVPLLRLFNLFTLWSMISVFLTYYAAIASVIPWVSVPWSKNKCSHSEKKISYQNDDFWIGLFNQPVLLVDNCMVGRREWSIAFVILRVKGWNGRFHECFQDKQYKNYTISFIVTLKRETMKRCTVHVQRLPGLPMLVSILCIILAKETGFCERWWREGDLFLLTIALSWVTLYRD